MFPVIAGSVLANLTAQNALRVAAGGLKGGGRMPEAKPEPGEPTGSWEGVQCCPGCLEPVTQKEILAACCSHCGRTENAYLRSVTRARRQIVDASGNKTWEWKDSWRALDRSMDLTVIVVIVLAIAAAVAVVSLAL